MFLGLHDLCEIIFGFANDHLPLEDADHDGFRYILGSGHVPTVHRWNALQILLIVNFMVHGWQ